MAKCHSVGGSLLQLPRPAATTTNQNTLDCNCIYRQVAISLPCYPYVSWHFKGQNVHCFTFKIMNPVAWTSLVVLFLLILVTLVDKTLGRGTFYLFVGIFLTSLAYVRSLLFDQSVRNKLTLPVHLFATSQGATVDWSPYLPQIPQILTTLPSEASLETEVATLADKITENYISSWYQFIGDDPHFVHDVRQIINAALYKLVTEHFPNVDVDALLPDLIKTVNGHMRGQNGEFFADEKNRDQLLSQFSEWILNELGPSDLLQLKSIRCSSSQKRDASYYLLKEILAKGALKGVIDALSEPRVIIRSIIKLLYGNKEEALTLYLGDIKDGNEIVVEEDGESSIQVIPKILVSSTTSAKDHSSKVDTHQVLHQEEPVGQESSKDSSSSILKTLTEKLRFPLSIEQLNRSKSNLDSATGVEKGIEATEQTGDLKLISNIRIEDTKKATAKGGSHIIYKIVYDGLFEEIEANINSFKPVCSCIVRKEVVVWHRFSDFVTLHEQLESDRKMRLYLKNIRSPSRLKTVAIFESKLEKSITQMRANFLTKYLNSLASIQVICNSRDFRAFMEYGHDEDDINRRSLLEASSPELTLKLEKMVTGGIKNVVSAVKKVLPTETYQEGLLALLSPGPTRNVVPVITGDFTALDDSLRSMKMSNRLCLLFSTKDDSYSSFDFTPSPSPLSASISSKSSSYFTHNCNSISKNHISKCNPRKRKSQERITEPTIDFVEIIFTQKLQCTWWALAVKVFMYDLLESYFNALKSLCLAKVSLPCLLNLLHSTMWPDLECTVAVEADEDAAAMTSDPDHPNDNHLHDRPQSTANSPLDLLKRSAWILDFLSIDFDSILPFLVEKFSSKDANVTLIYNLINIFFARLKIDSNTNEGVTAS